MKGILLTEDQNKWFQEMLVESYDNEKVKDRILGALEILTRQPQEEWVHALNVEKGGRRIE